MWVWGALAVVMIAAIVWALRDMGGSSRRRVDPMERLLDLCHGDEEQALRLIEAQKKKNPEMSDLQATRRALRSLEHDRRR